MTNRVDSLIEQIRALEHDLAAEFSRQRSGFRFGLEHGRARFEEEALRRLEERRIHLVKYILGAPLLYVLTAPLIYSLILPSPWSICGCRSTRRSASAFTASPRSRGAAT